MTGAAVKRIRQALGLTQQEFADRLGVHKVTVAKWETGAQGMRGPAARLIVLFGEKAKATGSAMAKARLRKAPIRKKAPGSLEE